MIDTYAAACINEGLLSLADMLLLEIKNEDSIGEEYRHDILAYAEAYHTLISKSMECLDLLDGEITRWQEDWGPSE